MCKVLLSTSMIVGNALIIRVIKLVWWWHHGMKARFLVFLVLCAAAALAQNAPVLPNQVQMVQVPDHPQHAEQHAMACERPLVGAGPETYTTAQGERPLWEFGPVSEEPSLGEIARAYGKGKLTAKKAGRVFEKQGS